MDVQKPPSFVGKIREGNRITVPKEIMEFYNLQPGQSLLISLKIKQKTEVQPN